MAYAFKNDKLRALYNKLDSQEGYNLRGIKQISSAIYPLLEEVIHDDFAYSEAVFNWPEFQCVVDVVENDSKEYTGLSDEESMCYSLWWSTNHSQYEDQELEAIFSGVEDAYADSTILQQVNGYISNTGVNNDAEYIII
jgi:hypothetical protein